jgi:PKD repeat protein
VVKPAKPVANFAVDHQGLTVVFHNRSSGGSEGWWDFGDGAPLEPVSAKQETVTHTYPAASDYTVKLTLRNLIGEESERTFTVRLDGERAERPTIDQLEAIPVSPGAYAPATFRLISRTKNARLCVWDTGDDGPLQITTEAVVNQDRLISFKEPGSYMVKLAAINGDQAVEKSTIVSVDVPPAGMLTAVLSVADHGTRVDTVETTAPLTAAFPPRTKEATYKIDRQVPAKPGYEIVSARLEAVNDKGARGLTLQVTPDRKAARLTGELVKDGKNQAPSVLVRAVLKQERRVADNRPAVPVTGMLSVPGTALLVMPQVPANWADAQRQLRLELRDGDRVVWHESQLPRNAPVTVQNRRLTLSATPVGSQVRVELAEPKPAVHPAAN